MKQPADQQCSCEIAYCKDLHVNNILESLLKMKKGPQHTIMVQDSHELTCSNRNYRMFQLREKVRRMQLPYTLRFYERGPGLVCYWLFSDESKRSAKEWFDKNALEGRYPDCSGQRMLKH